MTLYAENASGDVPAFDCYAVQFRNPEAVTVRKTTVSVDDETCRRSRIYAARLATPFRRS